MRVHTAAYRCSECGGIVMPLDVPEHRASHAGVIELAPVLVKVPRDE